MKRRLPAGKCARVHPAERLGQEVFPRLFVLFFSALHLAAQGAIDPSQPISVLTTLPGQALISTNQSVLIDPAILAPELQFGFGFSTDETAGPGQIFDSFTISAQTETASLLAIFLTADVFGVNWAPPTPGALNLNGDQINRTALNFPELSPDLRQKVAFLVRVPLPPEFRGQPLRLYYDLFNNQNNQASLAWFTAPQVIPEPATWLLALLGVGASSCFGFARLRRMRLGGIGNARFRRKGLIGFCLLLWLGTLPLKAAEKTFVLQGGTVTLEEVTDDVSVFYQAMRLNRGSNVWNVDLSVTNRSGNALPGPLILLVESFSGTSGPLQPDGLDGPAPGKAFYNLTTLLANSRLGPGEKTRSRTLSLGVSAGSPALVVRVFAGATSTGVPLALTRTLNEVGQPLFGVEVNEITPNSPPPSSSDRESGLITLSAGAGPRTWKFAASGYLPVWRQQTLAPGQVALLPNPRLTRRGTNLVTISNGAGANLQDDSGAIQANFPPQSVLRDATGVLTPLTAQTLPALLPLGWSPLQAFWLEISEPLAAAATVRLALWGPLGTNESAALVRWDENQLVWVPAGFVAGTGGAVGTSSLPSSGAYALVVADLPPLAPPAAQIGQPLGGFAAPPASLERVKASGQVIPPVSAASTVPQLVTAQATVTFTNETGGLPSGTMFLCQVREKYQLQDGTRRAPAGYENYIAGYQRPGDDNLNTLQSQFPMRPLWLFGPDQLVEATVSVDVETFGAFSGGIIGTGGGEFSKEGLRIVSGPGDFSGPQPIQLSRLDPTNFAGLGLGGGKITSAFDLSVHQLEPDHRLAFQADNVPANAQFVLAKLLFQNGFYGFEPRERLRSDESGALTSLEPANGEKLPGITGAGQYLLIQLPAPHGLVSGVARNGAGDPAAGLVLKLLGQPWITFSASNGTYQLLAPTGSVQVLVTDIANRKTTQSAGLLSDPAAGVRLDVATTSSGPSILDISPSPAATGVSPVTAITINFTDPIKRSTLLGGAAQLFDPAGQPVGLISSLDLSDRSLTLLSTNPLAGNTRYTIVLSSNITDTAGLPLAGARTFSFTTARSSLDRPAGAQVISHEPTNGLALMEGTQGIADPESVVILLNETSGKTSTVLSKPDGSFSNKVEAVVEDFLSAVLVNQNGTRTTIPVSKQFFSDGRVGLFQGGGELSAQGKEGPVTLTIPAGAIPSKTIFHLEAVSKDQLPLTVSNTPPTNAVLIGGLQIKMDGDALTAPVKITYSFNPANIQVQPGEKIQDFAFLATVPRQLAGVTAYEYLARFELAGQGTNLSISLQSAGRKQAFLLDLVGVALVNGVDFLGFQAIRPFKENIEVLGNVQEAQIDHQTGLSIPSTERPLGGAVITLANRRLLEPQLRLDPGELFSVSDSDGRYGFFAVNPIAVGEGFVLTAIHPKYPKRRVGSPALILGAGQRAIHARDITFEIVTNIVDETAPSISASHRPARPAPGAKATLQVSASDDGGVFPVVVSIVNVVGGGATIADASINAVSANEFEVTSSKAARVDLLLSATDNAQNTRTLVYTIPFGGTEQFDPNPVFPINPNDTIGPYVVATRPAQGSIGVAPGDPIVIRFNEPIDALVPSNVNNYISIWPAAGPASATLQENQRELVLHFPRLEPGTNYTIGVQGLSDVSRQIFDQVPSTPPPIREPFSFSFNTATQRQANLPIGSVLNGGGAIVRGVYAYVLERQGNGALLVYDLSDPQNPVPVPGAEITFSGYPRDLVLIPHYSFVRGPGRAVETNDLLAVVGGRVQGEGGSQYLRIINISDPTHLSQIAAAEISLDGTAAITRVVWDPPNLAFIENKADFSAFHLVELQRFIYGRNVSATDRQLLPLLDQEGVDANHDGDFTDPGDMLPIPGLTTIGYPGRIATFTLDQFQNQPKISRTSRYINDLAIAGHGDSLGVVVGSGFDTEIIKGVSTNTVRVEPSYRSYLRGKDLDAGLTSVFFPGFNPKRVLLTTDIDWPDPSGVPTPRTLALVSLVGQFNDDSRLVVIDVTVNSATGLPARDILQVIDFPTNFFGLIQGMSRLEDGRIILSTPEDFILLDANLLSQPQPPASLHPSILGIVPKAGSGNSAFTLSGSGLGVSTLRGRSVVTQVAPGIQIVTGTSPVIDSSHAVNDPARLEEIGFFRKPLALTVADPATLQLSPPKPEAHYYVLVEAPGSAGPEIQLMIESLDHMGEPLARDPGADPPAVKNGVKAYRLLDDTHKGEPGYNLYLSTPIILADADLTAGQISSINGILPRVVLFAGNSLRASLDPAMANNALLGSFVTRTSGVPSTATLTSISKGVGVFTNSLSTLRVDAGVSTITPTRLTPALDAPTNAVLKTSVDRINTNYCSKLYFTFSLTHEAFVSFKIDGQSVTNATDLESEQIIPIFSNIPYGCGAHTILLTADNVGDVGLHPFELTASLLPYNTNLTLRVNGEISHEVEINNTYPIAHTIVSGVDLWDGHLTHSRQDVLIPGRRLSLDFTRSYSNLGDSRDGPLGAGWTHSYNVRLVERCNTFVVIGGEGSGNAFSNPNLNPVLEARYRPLLPSTSAGRPLEFFQPQIGYHSTLVRHLADWSEYFFFTKSGVRYHFVREPALGNTNSYTLREIREPNGNALILKYCDRGDLDPTTLDTVTELDSTPPREKRELQFTYVTNLFNNKRIIKLEAYNQLTGGNLYNLRIHYLYDTNGNLTNVVRAGIPGVDERSESYGYSPGHYFTGHNMTSYTDPNGSVTLYEYYPTNAGLAGFAIFSGGPNRIPGIHTGEIIRKVTRIGSSPAENIETIFDYDFIGKTRTVHDPRESEGVGPTVYTLNDYGATIMIQPPLVPATIMEWATDAPHPNVLDLSGNPARDGLMVKKVDPLGREHRYEYKDGRGNLTAEITVFSGAKAPVTLADGVTSVASISTLYAYDAVFNQRTNSVDAEGHATALLIDPANGNLRTVVDAENNVTAYDYFPNGDLKSKTDPRRNVTHYSYDDYGNPQSVEEPENKLTTNGYDERSRLTNSFDNFIHASIFAYDGLDRKTREEKINSLAASGPGQTNEYHYLSNGELSFMLNGLGHVTRHFYDNLNRRTNTVEEAVEQVRGPPVNYSLSFSYDRDNNLKTETDGRGVTKTHSYDALNRRKTTDLSGPFGPNLQIFAGGYDAANNLTNEFNLHGHETKYVHDGLYRVTQTILPLTAAPAVLRIAYDRVGNKVIQTDANGNASVMVYDRIYRLMSATDPATNTVIYAYDQNGNKTNEHNLSSGLISSTENIDGLNRPRLIKKIVPLGGPGLTTATYETKFEYLDAQNAVRTTNPRNFLTLSIKDGLDRVYQVITDEGGLNLTQTTRYDANRNVKAVIDAEGNDVDVEHDYDGLNRKIRSRHVLTPSDQGRQPVEEFSYDAGGNLINWKDKRDVEFSSAFDNLNRALTNSVVETTSSSSVLPLASYVYDDAANSVLFVDANGNPTTTFNDELGRARQVDDPDPGLGITFQYDGMNKRSETDKKNQRTVFNYEPLNRLTETLEYDASGALQTSNKVEYLDRLNLRRNTDRRGIVTISQLDALGRVVQMKKAHPSLASRYGAVEVVLETHEYDGNGNQTNSLDAVGNRTARGYDGADRMTVVIEGLGSPVAGTNSYTYDHMNNMLTSKDARAHGGAFDVRNVYDARYRKVSAENGELEMTRYSYDENNNLTEMTEPMGPPFITRYQYDELNKLIAVDESPRAVGGTAAGVTRFFYDANRNRIGQQDANGNLVSYRYDALNRLTNTLQHTVVLSLSSGTTRAAFPISAPALSWQFAYDLNGNQSLVVDARSQRVDVVYDWLNRPTSRTYSNHAEPGLDYQVQALTYVYDPNGNLTLARELKNRGGGAIWEETAMEYDGLDRIESRARFDYDFTVGKTNFYAYDRQGNRTQIIDPDGFRTVYTFDNRNRLETVTTEAGLPTARTTRYTWWEDSLPKTTEYPNSTISDRSGPASYDRADRLLVLINHPNNPAAPYSRYEYSYDANGNRATQREMQQAINGGAPEQIDYHYDNLNRLRQVQYGTNGSLSYSHAPNGNRLAELGVDPVTHLPINRSFVYGQISGTPNTFDGVNILGQIVNNLNPAESINYEYDRNLNQIARIQNGVRRQFRYDVRDQIIQSGVETNVAYDYNYERLRVKKVSAGTAETRYLYDQRSVLVEYGGLSSGHQSIHKYDYGYELLAITQVPPLGSRESDFFLLDGLMSTANLANETGGLKQSYQYDAWGRVRSQVGTSDNPRQYTGHYKDNETGLHYFGARYYDDETGRFLTEDPYLGEGNNPPSLHRYLYAYGNPLRYVDLTGYQTEETGKDEEKPPTHTEIEEAERKVEAEDFARGLRHGKVIKGESGRDVVVPTDPYFVKAKPKDEAEPDSTQNAPNFIPRKKRGVEEGTRPKDPSKSEPLDEAREEFKSAYCTGFESEMEKRLQSFTVAESKTDLGKAKKEPVGKTTTGKSEKKAAKPVVQVDPTPITQTSSTAGQEVKTATAAAGMSSLPVVLDPYSEALERETKKAYAAWQDSVSARVGKEKDPKLRDQEHRLYARWYILDEVKQGRSLRAAIAQFNLLTTGYSAYKVLRWVTRTLPEDTSDPSWQEYEAGPQGVNSAEGFLESIEKLKQPQIPTTVMPTIP